MNDAASETNGNGGGSGGSPDTTNQQFVVHRIYVKDLSFEVPGAPGIFAELRADPEIQLNLRNTHTALGDNTYEVVLHISVHAKIDEQTVFVTEVDQAGIFQIQGYDDEQLKRLAATYCPATLFPYARETIANAVSKGGFPPLTLQPINFDALFAQASEEATRQ